MAKSFNAITAQRWLSIISVVNSHCAIQRAEPCTSYAHPAHSVDCSVHHGKCWRCVGRALYPLCYVFSIINTGPLGCYGCFVTSLHYVLWTKQTLGLYSLLKSQAILLDFLFPLLFLRCCSLYSVAIVSVPNYFFLIV